MTDAQINAAIAKALNADEHWMIQKNYCNDLNAMAQAEKMLNPAQIEDYVIEVMGFSHEPIFATARQRAEAFLRTLGKWEEVQE